LGSRIGFVAVEDLNKLLAERYHAEEAVGRGLVVAAVIEVMDEYFRVMAHSPYYRTVMINPVDVYEALDIEWVDEGRLGLTTYMESSPGLQGSQEEYPQLEHIKLRGVIQAGDPVLTLPKSRRYVLVDRGGEPWGEVNPQDLKVQWLKPDGTSAASWLEGESKRIQRRMSR
jgi:hypothetical protein